MIRQKMYSTLLVDSGYDDIHVVQDLSGNDRVVYGRYDREDNR